MKYEENNSMKYEGNNSRMSIYKKFHT